MQVFSDIFKDILSSYNILVYNINERHTLLSTTIGTRPEEDISYSRAQVILPSVVVFFVVASSIEVAAYLLFNHKVINIEYLAVIHNFLFIVPSMEGHVE